MARGCHVRPTALARTRGWRGRRARASLSCGSIPWVPSGISATPPGALAKKRGQAQLYHAARKEARDHAALNPPPHTDPGEALQWIVDQLADEVRFHAKVVDGLKVEDLQVMTGFGVVDHASVRALNRSRKELADLCVNMERVGLAERMVRVEEARALLIVQALIEAAAEAGIPRAKLKQIGPAFRRRLTAIEGGAETTPGKAAA